MRRLLFVLIALILYGSLYPFEFRCDRLPGDPWALMMRAWPAVNRYLLRDTVINVLLYVPLGAAAYLTAARRLGKAASLGLALLLGTALSCGIEFAQIFDRLRTASAFDILCNSLGTAAGATLAFAYADPIRRALSGRRRQLQAAPDAMLLLLLFAGAQLYPLFPQLSTYALAAKLRSLLHPGITLTGLLGAAAEWLCAALALEAVLGPGHIRRNFALLLLVLPVRLLLAGPAAGWVDLLGAGAAAGLWMLLPAASPGRYRAAAAIVLGCMVLRGLAPYHFAPRAASFNWMPFAVTLGANWQTAAPILLRKIFQYGAAVWLLRRGGMRYIPAGFVAACALAAVEAAQLWLPGRSPEITDPLLALLMAWLLLGLEKEPRPKTSVR